MVFEFLLFYFGIFTRGFWRKQKNKQSLQHLFSSKCQTLTETAANSNNKTTDLASSTTFVPCSSFNTELWIEYTVLFVILTLLLPCFWVTFIWEEIIDPHYESESIPLPEHRILRFFYSISGRITQNLAIRNLIYIVISGLFITSAVRDVVGAGAPWR